MRFHVLADELILALGLVNGETATRNDAEAVSWLELEIPERRTENDASDLSGRVLEREIQMAGVPEPAIGQFAFDPHLKELVFQHVPEPDRQFRDGQDSARGDRCCRDWRLVEARTRRLDDRLTRVVFFFEREIEQIRHRDGSPQSVDCRFETPSSSRSPIPRLRRSISTAFPVCESDSTITAFNRGLPLAVSNLAGSALRNRPSAAWMSMPMIES